MAAFTLAHLSDPHLPPLPAARLRDLAGKRALGYLNWTRNRHKYHRRDVLDALVSDMQAAGAGSHRDHRRSRQSRARSRVRAGAGLARERRRAGSGHGHSRQSRRLCARHAAPLRANAWRLICAAMARGGEATFPFAAPARPAGADRRVVGGPDAAPDGDRMARPHPARARSNASWRSCRREQAFRVLLIHHPAAFGLARQAADRFTRSCSRC